LAGADQRSGIEMLNALHLALAGRPVDQAIIWL
jgi:hypothetical protein